MRRDRPVAYRDQISSGSRHAADHMVKSAGMTADEKDAAPSTAASRRDSTRQTRSPLARVRKPHELCTKATPAADAFVETLPTKSAAAVAIHRPLPGDDISGNTAEKE